MRFDIAGFKGRLPRIAARNLPEANATVAANCDLRSGSIRSLHQRTQVADLSANGQFVPDSLHRWDNGNERFWLQFGGAANVVRGPVADDVRRRIYWTDDANHDEPRMSYTGFIDEGDGPYPGASFKLGVPAPGSPVGVSVREPLSGTVAAVNHTRPIRIETASKHGLEDGMTVTFDISAQDPGSDQTDLEELLNNGDFQITLVSDTEFELDNTDAVAVDYTAFIDGSWEEFTGAEIQETFFYLHTYVTAIGEQGPPDDPEAAQQIEASPFQARTLSLPSLDAVDGYNITKRRIYRSNTGASASQFQFLAELDIGDSSFEDRVLSGLGESIPSVTWDPPPANLSGIRVSNYGFAAGFFDNVVAVSEPYMPHAWPTNYQIALDYDVVAIEIVTNGIAVATTGRPYLIQGVDPRSMIPQKLYINEACVSARSMAAMGYSAIYASANGLVSISDEGAQLITRNIVTEREWVNFHPETLHGVELNERYIGFYDGGGLIFDPREPEIGMIDLSFTAIDTFADERDPFMYLLEPDRTVSQWEDRDGGVEPFRWRSRIFVSRYPINPAAAQIITESADASRTLTLRLYGDGELRYETTVAADQAPFALPGGYTAREFQIEVEGDQPVQRITLAEGLQELTA